MNKEEVAPDPAISELECKLAELRSQLESNKQEWEDAICEQSEAWADHAVWLSSEARRG